ncbi:MAG: monovalent cation/H+ antiporter subunit A [Bradyrhizobiaceae bacterium]|nr:MAG: monovalent cation/H+ antiporter subunit A [Bradyrhizobiaceae bacterium]
MSSALVVLIPFLAAAFPPLAARLGRSACAGTAAAATLVSLALLLANADALWSAPAVAWRADWLPQVGLSFSFRLDALAVFFALLILAIGVLIIVYARHYLAPADPAGRFYAYLLLFQGSMLGIVAADNVLLMLVFWELTSLSSFLLIGYWNHAAESRRGARMALVVTGGGGFALIAGMLILGEIAGSYQISEILQRGEAIRESPLYLPALILILIGAFTKSAQFPFHFWLPHAMAAPTPVSAYLHSATMVKAGIFLMARLWPALAGTEAWFLIVSLTGLVTMVVAAWIACFRDDLKALLAFSTVSHLGLITMLLGFGTPAAAAVAVLHVLNHATFKAALFMSVGIVDHEAGTRDIRRLGGLLWLMPITGTLALVAAASMAGVPLLNGYISKEMMLEQAAVTSYAGLAWLVPAMATLGALLSAGYSARLVIGAFLGRPHPGDAGHGHDPSPGMWGPVAVLVALVVALGVAPQLLAAPLVEPAARAVTGGEMPPLSLAIWHGVTPALAMSLIALAGGLAFVAVQERLDRLREAFPRPDAKRMFEAALSACVRAADRLIAATHTQVLHHHASVAVLAIAGAAAAWFWIAPHAAGERAPLPASAPAVTAWLVLIVATATLVLRHRDRLFAIVLTSVVGLIVSLTFMQFSAPDLALTQVSVEVVTTILLLLALNLLPKETPAETGAGWRSFDAVVASAVGLGAGGLAYALMTRSVDSISAFHVAQAKPGGGGTNVVNVILVDFRGFDTFGEIIVLGIAALAIYALLDSALRGAAARRLAAMRPGLESADAHPLLLVVATRVLLPLVVTVGAYIFFRGHNLPGGGFIAGLIVAVALIMQYMASGYSWTAARARFDAHLMIGGGVAIAGLTGVASWLFGRPFLTSTFDHVHLPLIGEIELASAVAFDLGVFLTVVGTVLLSLATISRVEERAEPPSPPAEEPRTLPRQSTPAPARPRALVTSEGD